MFTYVDRVSPANPLHPHSHPPDHVSRRCQARQRARVSRPTPCKASRRGHPQAPPYRAGCGPLPRRDPSGVSPHNRPCEADVHESHAVGRSGQTATCFWLIKGTESDLWFRPKLLHSAAATQQSATHSPPTACHQRGPWHRSALACLAGCVERALCLLAIFCPAGGRRHVRALIYPLFLYQSLGRSHLRTRNAFRIWGSRDTDRIVSGGHRRDLDLWIQLPGLKIGRHTYAGRRPRCHAR